MTSKDKYSKKAKDKANEVLSSSPTLIDSMEEVLSKLDDSIEKVELKLGQSLKEGAVNNDLNVPSFLSEAVKAARNYTIEVTTNISIMEKMITLNFPVIEDGNNFGVTVQLSILKMLKETREALSTKIKAIGASYYDARANAIDKLGLAKETMTETITKTQGKSESQSSKDNAKETEEKGGETRSEEKKKSGASAVDSYRMQQLLAIDLQAYVDAKAALVAALDGYCAICDNVSKNKDKLESPKGLSGGTSHMSMF